jgi:Triose-phosphate Transporter family
MPSCRAAARIVGPKAAATAVTFFFIALWYGLNVGFNLTNKSLFNVFPFPWFVSTIHVVVGTAYCFVAYLLGAKGASFERPITRSEFMQIFGPASMHAIGHVAANLSFAAVAISLTHTVKTLEPAFNVVLSKLILGTATPLPVAASLLPIMVRDRELDAWHRLCSCAHDIAVKDTLNQACCAMAEILLFNASFTAPRLYVGTCIAPCPDHHPQPPSFKCPPPPPLGEQLSMSAISQAGVALASAAELSFNWLGFLAAMVSNLTFGFRAVWSKKAMADIKNLGSTGVYAYTTLISVFICAPGVYLFEGQKLAAGIDNAIAIFGAQGFYTRLLAVGLLYHLYNQFAFNTLGRVSPVSHGVCNVVKRICIIATSVLFFGNKLSLQTQIGTAIALLGTWLYTDSVQRQKVKAQAKPA